MTTWDFGGGCPCGLSKVCDCANARYEEFNPSLRKIIKMSKDFDFGFSTAKEEDLRTEDKTKLYGLRDMFMPLLNNLMKNPEQELIKWPNRKAKIEEFIKKMNEYIEK